MRLVLVLPPVLLICLSTVTRGETTYNLPLLQETIRSILSDIFSGVSGLIDGENDANDIAVPDIPRNPISEGVMGAPEDIFEMERGKFKEGRNTVFSNDIVNSEDSRHI